MDKVIQAIVNVIDRHDLSIDEKKLAITAIVHVFKISLELN